MLHRINLPGYGDKMSRILDFQFSILSFACDPLTRLPLTEEIILEKFPQTGRWLCEKLWGRKGEKNSKGTRFLNDLIKLIEYIQSHQDIGPTIVESFRHDITFPDHFDDSDFKFSYIQLGEDARDALRPLMQAFYDFFSSGYPQCVHGYSLEFNRSALKSAFYESNPKLRACPACDCKPPDNVDGRSSADEDHFLPISKYPFLSVHPANLVPICLECNLRFKGVHDPIDDHNNAPLVNTFHPYNKPAIDFIDVEVDRNPEGLHNLTIKDKEIANSRRVKNLNDVLNLEKRWEKRLERIIDCVTEEVLMAGEGYRRSKSISEVNLRDQLKLMLDFKMGRISQQPEYVLQTSYLRYALNNKDEFKILTDQFYATYSHQ